MKLATLFYPHIAKASPGTGRIPMYMRITLNREKAEMRLNIDIRPDDLTKWDQATMRFADRNMAANITLNEIEKSFEDFRYHHATSLSRLNVRSIRNKIMGIDDKPIPSVLDYTDRYYKNAVADNSQLTEGTKRNYRKALTHLYGFLVFRKTKKLLLADVNMNFACGFRDYPLGNLQGCQRPGMKEPSSPDNIKKLRPIFDRAVEEGLLQQNPFKKIKLKSKSGHRGSATLPVLWPVFHN